MKSKLFLCAALAAALYVTPSYAADYSAQVVSFSQEDPDNLSIELTGSKVITDDFSFKQALHSGSALRRAVCQRQRRIYTMQRNRDLAQEEFHFLYQRRRDG